MAEPTTTRDRLMSAAFELFEERGYDGASVDDIAARAGVGRTTAFRQFGSKEALIFPDHEGQLRRADERLSVAAATAIPSEVIAVATAVFEQYLAEGERARARYRLTSSVPTLRDFETATTSRYKRLFSKHLQRAWPQDKSGRLQAEMFATAVVTAHNHVLRRWLRGEVDSTTNDLADALSMAWSVLEGRSVGRTAVVVISTDEPIDSLAPRLRDFLGDPA